MTLSAFNTRTQLLILPPLFPFFCACSVTVKEKMSYFRNGQRMEAQHGFNLLVTTIQSPSLLLCSFEGSLKDCSSAGAISGTSAFTKLQIPVALILMELPCLQDRPGIALLHLFLNLKRDPQASRFFPFAGCTV